MEKKRGGNFFGLVASVFLPISLLLAFGCSREEPLSSWNPKRAPDDVKVVFSDIDLFWETFDNTVEPIDKHFEIRYFLGGSSGLEHYFKSTIRNSEHMTSLLKQQIYRDYFVSLRGPSLLLHHEEEEVLSTLTDFNELYPDCVFTDIYFVLGPFRSAGHILHNGDLVIGVEFLMKTDTTHWQGLPQFLHSAIRPKNYLKTVVAHEMAHVQQIDFSVKNNIDMSDRTLLEVCISEGVAEFLSYLLTDSYLNEHLASYYNMNKSELLESFKNDMDSHDYSNWLFNTSTIQDRPADLGYYIGFLIAQKHYERFGDISKLVKVTNANQFLNESLFFETAM